MNADDMSKPVFGSFYLRSALSKAVPVHTTPLMGAQRRESPANRELLNSQKKIRIVQFSRFGRPAEPVFAVPVPCAAQPLVRPEKLQASEPQSQRPGGPMRGKSEPGSTA